MINYYQPFLFPFIQTTPHRQPLGLKTYYYHSFEDALWDFLDHKFPGRKLRFLVPDFYCSDVLDNIKSRGHEYIYYQLDQDFQIAPSQFQKYLWLNQPDIVIIFHACGITSNLLKNLTWLSDFPKTSLIIEDSVHKLVNPQQVKLVNTRHFVIDSLRKVSPLPGSRIFGLPNGLDFIPSQSSFISSYFLSSFFLFLLFKITLSIGFVVNSASLVSFAHNQILKAHDNIIGDSLHPQTGLSSMKPFISRLNYAKVAKLKNHQVSLYRKYFKEVFNLPNFYNVQIPQSDFGHLHVFPLGVLTSSLPELTDYLHARNIPVWFKFTDTPWSQRRGVIFLPLGFHISDHDIQKLSSLIYHWSIDTKSTGAVFSGVHPVLSV